MFLPYLYTVKCLLLAHMFECTIIWFHVRLKTNVLNMYDSQPVTKIQFPPTWSIYHRLLSGENTLFKLYSLLIWVIKLSALDMPELSDCVIIYFPVT